MKRWGLAATAAGLLALCVAVPAQAAAEFCIVDPELQIQLSRDANITVYITEGVVGPEHLPALARAKANYTTVTLSKKSVLVTVYDFIPADSFGTSATMMIVSSQPYGAGKVYGSAYGTSGTTMSVSFAIDPQRVNG
jgi:hypothetical protein